MSTALIELKTIAGGTLTASGNFPFAVNRAGTSQVIQVSFDTPISGVETVQVPVAISSGAGRGTLSYGTDVLQPTTTLQFDSTTNQAFLTVTGDDLTGTFVVEIGPADSDDDAGDYEGAGPVTLSFFNNSNEPQAGNRAPSDPSLKFPADNARVSAGANLRFEWEHAYDADGDELQYNLCFSEDEEMAEMKCMSVDESAIVENSGVAGSLFEPNVSSLSALLLASVILVMVWRRIRTPRTKMVRRIVQLGLFFVVMGLGLSGCGETKLMEALQLPSRPKVRATLPASTLLESGKTYYWKVYADDSKGNIVSSAQTRRIRTL